MYRTKGATMRRALATLTLAAVTLLGTAGTAIADPQFGPGNGQQNGDKCHPPGQTVDVPGCK
jgi:hypothetical protein